MTDLANALPCPFCGSTDLREPIWCEDHGEIDAIECTKCLGGAPAAIWNSRVGVAVDETEIQPLHLELIDG